MKRFYCTVCKQVKRVQQWPAALEDTYGGGKDPQKRLGECDRHFKPQTLGKHRKAKRKITLAIPAPAKGRK